MFNSTSLIFPQQLVSASLCCLHKHRKMLSHRYCTSHRSYYFQKGNQSFKGQKGNLVSVYITAFLASPKSGGFVCVITNPV